MIKIDPKKYILNSDQIECLADEFLGRCLELKGAELEIEFDNKNNEKQFLEILDKTFGKKP